MEIGEHLKPIRYRLHWALFCAHEDPLQRKKKTEWHIHWISRLRKLPRRVHGNIHSIIDLSLFFRDKDRGVSRSNTSDRSDSRSEAGSLTSQDSDITRFIRDTCVQPHGPGELPKEQQGALRAGLKEVRDKLCLLDTEAGLGAEAKEEIALKLAELEFKFCPHEEGSKREGDFAREFLASQVQLQPPPSPSRPPQAPSYRPPSPPRGTPTPDSPLWTWEEKNSVHLRSIIIYLFIHLLFYLFFIYLFTKHTNARSHLQ